MEGTLQNTLFNADVWIRYESVNGQVCLPINGAQHCIHTSTPVCHVGNKGQYPVLMDCSYSVDVARQLVGTGTIAVITTTPNAEQVSQAQSVIPAASAASSSGGQGEQAVNSAAQAIKPLVQQQKPETYSYALPLWAQVSINVVLWGTLLGFAGWYAYTRYLTQSPLRMAYASQQRRAQPKPPKIQFVEVDQ